MPQGGSFLLYEGKAGGDFWVKAETEKPQETEPAQEEQKTENRKRAEERFSAFDDYATSVRDWCSRFYIKMKGVKSASKKNQLDPDVDYHDADEDALQLPEDDGDEDEEVDVNEDYEAESDYEPV